MFSFLSEIEKFQKLQGIKKNKLADKIKTSASYLTQLYRGSKPLNFETIAKIQKALNIAFTVLAKPCNSEINIDENFFMDLKCQYKTSKGMWVYKNFSLPKDDEIYDNKIDESILKNAIEKYDDKAIPA